MNKNFFILLFLFPSILLIHPAFTQEEKKRIISAGYEGLNTYLEKIPPGNELLYGYQNRDEFSIATLGEPYNVYILNEDFYTESSLDPEKDYLKQTGEFRVPIIVNGDYRSTLIIAMMDGTYKAVGIGAAGLAKEIEEFEKVVQEENSHVIFRVLQIQSEFLLVNGPLNIYAFPLKSGRMALDDIIDPDPLFKLSFLLPLIKQKIPTKNE